MYYFFYLEMALKDESDSSVYAFINVSHIPTSKLIEIFKINLTKDPQILEGYFLKPTYYKKHKKYIAKEIGQINLKLFEYTLLQYVSHEKEEIRKLYKLKLME